MQFRVKFPKQDIVCILSIEPSDTIKDIKEILQKKTKFNASSLKLYYENTRLEDDRSITDSSLSKNSLIKCYVKPEFKLFLQLSQEIVDKTGFIRDQTLDIDKEKETALTGFKAFIRQNKDSENKPQKLRSDQFEKILTIGEPIQPELIETILEELDLKKYQQLDEQKFLTYFKTEIGNY